MTHHVIAHLNPTNYYLIVTCNPDFHHKVGNFIQLKLNYTTTFISQNLFNIFYQDYICFEEEDEG